MHLLKQKWILILKIAADQFHLIVRSARTVLQDMPLFQNSYTPHLLLPKVSSASFIYCILLSIAKSRWLHFQLIILGQGTIGNKDGAARLVNGDVSSHSSVASNGAVPNGSLSSRKRRPSSWSRGFISKPKKKKLSEDQSQEKQDIVG